MILQYSFKCISAQIFETGMKSNSQRVSQSEVLSKEKGIQVVIIGLGSWWYYNGNTIIVL